MARNDATSYSAVNGAGDLLRLVRSGPATTRAEVAALSGMSRAAVAQRLNALLARGLIRSAGELPSTGGRPAGVFEFNASAGTVLSAEIGASHIHVAITDLAANVLEDSSEEVSAAEGPEKVLGLVHRRFAQLLERSSQGRGSVFGIGVGLACPVEFATGRPVNPPIMLGWDRFGVADWLGERWGVPTLVDNEVNMMAVGEHATTWSGESELLCIKVGTGIGCGVISHGQIHRGAQGAAGDIGHVRVVGQDDVVCNCGNVGCLEAVAGGGALARDLRAQGISARTSRDVVRLVRGGRGEAIQLVRRSGRLLGDVLAGAVNLFNPAVIIIGGEIAEAEEQLLAGVRETIYKRSLPLATKHLRIVRSQLSGRASVIGAAFTVIDHVLAPDAVDATLATRAAAQ
jgi:predicted NBD/HSP70 family sugar kinase